MEPIIPEKGRRKPAAGKRDGFGGSSGQPVPRASAVQSGHSVLIITPPSTTRVSPVM